MRTVLTLGAFPPGLVVNESHLSTYFSSTSSASQPPALSTSVVV